MKRSVSNPSFEVTAFFVPVNLFLQKVALSETDVTVFSDS